jgi:phosphate-selective porin OprO/OprP
MTVRKALVLGAASFALLGTAAAQPPTSSPTTEDARDARIRELEERLEALASQIADLKASSASESQDIRRIQSEAPQVTLNNARPQFATSDGKNRVAISGVFQFDAANYEQESPGGVDNRRAGADATEGPNARDLNSGTNFRRARLGVEGTFAGDWNYALTAELGGSGTEAAQLQQAWVEYAGLKPFGLQNPVRLRVGAFTPPTGLEDATSSNDALFVERAAPADLVRGIAGGEGRTGVQVLANGDRWFTGAALTGALIGNTADFDEQLGAVARTGVLVLRDPDYGVHVGANFNGVLEPSDRVVGPGVGNGVRLRERPELRVDGTRLVDTGGLNAEKVYAYGAELGGQWKGFYIAGEYNWIDVQRFAGASDLEFAGWYVQGSWIPTGEQRKWGPATGGFGAVRPAKPFNAIAGDWGAWELAARHSNLDLNDNEGSLNLATPANGVQGGEQTISTVGLNWFPNNIVRFQLQDQDVSVERLNPGTVGLAAVGAEIGQDFQTVVLRTQLSF